MMQEARSAAPGRPKKSTPAAKNDGHSAATGAAFQHYQSAVQHLQQGRFDKALAILEKLLPDAPVEIKERCQMYISTCKR